MDPKGSTGSRYFWLKQQRGSLLQYVMFVTYPNGAIRNLYRILNSNGMLQLDATAKNPEWKTEPITTRYTFWELQRPLEETWTFKEVTFADALTIVQSIRDRAKNEAARQLFLDLCKRGWNMGVIMKIAQDSKIAACRFFFVEQSLGDATQSTVVLTTQYGYMYLHPYKPFPIDVDSTLQRPKLRARVQSTIFNLFESWLMLKPLEESWKLNEYTFAETFAKVQTVRDRNIQGALEAMIQLAKLSWMYNIKLTPTLPAKA